MTKEIYTYFSEKDSSYLNKARLFYGLYIMIFISLIVLMFVYQIYSYFVTLMIIIGVMYFLYRLVFFDFIFYIGKRNDFKRIKLMKRFDIVDEVIEYFSDDVYKNLFDDDYVIIHKNDVYVLAKIELEDTIYTLGLAVYQLDKATDEVSHLGMLEEKIKAIEDIDEKVVGTILEHYNLKNISIAVLPDHPVPVKLRHHTRDAVPLMIYKPGKKGEKILYSEKTAKKGSIGLLKGQEFMDLFLKS